MSYARCHLVDPTAPGFFHCVSRCVRRAFPCGIDEVTNQHYEHRRPQLQERIHLLADRFAVALHACAVMSNHLHLVIAIDPLEPTNWTDAEVVERWRRVFPVKARSVTPVDDTDPNALSPDQRVEPERIASWSQPGERHRWHSDRHRRHSGSPRTQTHRHRSQTPSTEESNRLRPQAFPMASLGKNLAIESLLQSHC